jgi:hypothetical protein
MNRIRNAVASVTIVIVTIGLFLIASIANAASANQRDYWGPRYQTQPQLNFARQSGSRLGLDAVPSGAKIQSV